MAKLIKKCAFGSVINNTTPTYDSKVYSFNKAFATARSKNQEYFMWDGDKYTTILADDVQEPEYVLTKGVDMSIDDLYDFIKSFESFRDKTYLDGKGNATIGYGLTKIFRNGKWRSPKEGDIITEQEASKYLKNYITDKMDTIKSYFSNWNYFPTNTKMALFDMGYNGGADIFLRSPKFNKALNDAFSDEKLSLKEVKKIALEMNLEKNEGANKIDRKLRRLAMIAGWYDHSKTKDSINKATSNLSPYKDFDKFLNYYFK